MSAKTDIIVLGAGAAGLAAARELRRKGFDVLVLEARDRIGGRILTHRDPRVPIPIELGAELIHGETPETLGVLREAGLSPCDVRGEQWRIRSGRVQPFPDVWKRTERVLAHIDGRTADRSFAEFLAEQPGGRRLAPDRTIARRFVQGFHAADPDCLSTRSLAGGGETEGVRKSGRVLEGYGSLPAWLARDLEGRIRLDTPVEAIEWSRGQVEVAARGARITAQAAVITVPLGVLQAPFGEPGTLRISPEPPRLRRILDGLAMGSAVRLAVWFRELPWEKAAKRDLSRLSFLHTSGEFNVWWSAYPVQVPLAVAWSGGPPAARLARQSRPDLEAQAFRGLAHQLGIPRRRVESLVVETWMHDWEGDPFSRGAYSYPLVGGSEAAQALSRPFDGTLFFAGEATALQNGNGTVEGALASGRRAAGQVARSRDAMQRNIRKRGKQHTRRP